MEFEELKSFMTLYYLLDQEVFPSEKSETYSGVA